MAMIEPYSCLFSSVYGRPTCRIARRKNCKTRTQDLKNYDNRRSRHFYTLEPSRLNDNPAIPGCRNGVADQTKQAIIDHFTANGERDVLGKHNVFVFRTNLDLCQCERNLPGW